MLLIRSMHNEFGRVIQRSDDLGKAWKPVGNQLTYEDDPVTHLWYDDTPHPWGFLRVWHLEPSLSNPDTIYAGAEDAALFKSLQSPDDPLPESVASGADPLRTVGAIVGG